MRWEKGGSLVEKVGDGVVMVVGVLVKMWVVILGMMWSGVVFVLGVVLVGVVFGGVMVGMGGGGGVMWMLGSFNVVLGGCGLWGIVMYIGGMVVVGIGLVRVVWMILREILKWEGMVWGVKWRLVIVWIVSGCVFGMWLVMEGGRLGILGVVV